MTTPTAESQDRARRAEMTNRELDRKVAEALGWVKSDNPRPSGQLYGSYEWTDPQGHKECTESMIPNYSTDIAAAIGALEGFAREMLWEIKYLPNGNYWCMIYDPARCQGLAESKSLCEAICNAILAASHGEKGDK